MLFVFIGVVYNIYYQLSMNFVYHLKKDMVFKKCKSLFSKVKFKLIEES